MTQRVKLFAMAIGALLLAGHFVTTLRAMNPELEPDKKNVLNHESRSSLLPAKPAIQPETFALLFGIEAEVAANVQTEVEHTFGPENIKLIAVDEQAGQYRAMLWVTEAQGSKMVPLRQGDMLNGFTLTALSMSEAVFSGPQNFSLKLFAHHTDSPKSKSGTD